MEQGQIRITVTDDSNNIDIRYTDNGKGLNPEQLAKLFHPFFTTKPPGEGTGLGLSISYSIIQKHQGTISFESEIGRGTKVSILLPLKSEK